MGPIDALAPYLAPADMTVDALARHFTVQAFAASCRLFNHPAWAVPEERAADGKPAGAFREALRGFNRDSELAWTLFVAAYLLRDKIGETSEMPMADMLRRDIDTMEMVSETLPCWLRGYGIDPERIILAVKAEREATP